ncbi:hypothetical protein K439DRAFT_1627332 [Ramaria rubella]|nr:hypothetical protein K439DRAFT_1627332 [Ramaria rubella]
MSKIIGVAVSAGILVLIIVGALIHHCVKKRRAARANVTAPTMEAGGAGQWAPPPSVGRWAPPPNAPPTQYSVSYGAPPPPNPFQGGRPYYAAAPPPSMAHGGSYTSDDKFYEEKL